MPLGRKTTTQLKLGTRRSLLAWAQSGWVAREVERLNPGVTVELIGIDTRGDRIQDVPLQSVEGKEFFVAEIDEALRSGSVDLTVHSMKDLSLERPREFVCAAVPPRENARDCVLFGPGVMAKLRAGQPLKIGTSSPRRLENVPAFLAEVLPQVSPGKKAFCEFVEIRGNVNTRLSRIHGGADPTKALDAVVLAFAGLIRLWRDEQGKRELGRLLNGVRWMVLPLRECPAAPAQGALAVECRAGDASIREMLQRLNHAETARLVSLERALLAQWGGGCHQKFGATAVEHPEAGTLMYVRGVKPDDAFVDEVRWKTPLSEKVTAIWDGVEWRQNGRETEATDVGVTAGLRRASEAYFIAHSRAVTHPWVESVSKARIWTSGTTSWKALAAQGIWVEGCAESLGFSWIETTLAEAVLQLPPSGRWTVLSHEGADRDWSGQRFVATYRAGVDGYSSDAKAALAAASHVYWSSGSQFEELKGGARAGATHACGPGKTAAVVRRAGIKPLVFPSIEEWRKWAKV